MSRGAFTNDTRRKVVQRQDGGCWFCGVLVVDTLDYTPLRLHAYHHRLPRRSGGRFGEMARVCASPANALLLCDPHHLIIESDRTKALAWGLLVPEGHLPTTVPVFEPQTATWWLLDSNGGRSLSQSPVDPEGVAA